MNLFVCQLKHVHFKCNDEKTNKLKSPSKSQFKAIKFDEYYDCLCGGDYQEE